VLHRIMVSGSDRACEKWMTDYDIPKIDQLALHHFYRAMAWLGEELDADQQAMLQGPQVLDGLMARSAPLRTGIPARKHSADGDRRLTLILRQSRWNCYCCQRRLPSAAARNGSRRPVPAGGPKCGCNEM
jgi:hypothetical protein